MAHVKNIHGYVRYQGELKDTDYLEYLEMLENLWSDHQKTSYVNNTSYKVNKLKPLVSKDKKGDIEIYKERLTLILHYLVSKGIKILPSVLSYYSNDTNCGSIFCLSRDKKFTIEHHFHDDKREMFNNHKVNHIVA